MDWQATPEKKASGTVNVFKGSVYYVKTFRDSIFFFVSFMIWKTCPSRKESRFESWALNCFANSTLIIPIYVTEKCLRFRNHTKQKRCFSWVFRSAFVFLQVAQQTILAQIYIQYKKKIWKCRPNICNFMNYKHVDRRFFSNIKFADRLILRL